MEVDFSDEYLDRLEADRDFDAGFGREVVKGFRKLMQIVRGATDERDFYALKGFTSKNSKVAAPMSVRCESTSSGA